MNQKDYRIVTFVPVVGIGGSLFFTYVILHAIGVVPWKVFPRMKDFNPVDDPGAIPLFVLLGVGCLFLVWTLLLKVTVDETGIWYRGLLCSVRLRWADIIRVNNHPRGSSIHLWTERKHLAISTMFLHQSDLRSTIAEQVKQNSADALVDASPLPFWSR